MWTIYSDYPIIRRQRLHHLVDDQEALVWSGKEITEAIAYAFLQGHVEVRLEGFSVALVVTIWPDGPLEAVTDMPESLLDAAMFPLAVNHP